MRGVTSRTFATLFAPIACSSSEAGRPDLYNVCSGHAYLVQDLLDTLLGLARIPLSVVSDPARMRPSDNPIVLGDASRIRAETGWTPRIPIERTLADLLDHWRTHVSASPA